MTVPGPTRTKSVLTGLRFLIRRLSQERITQAAASLTFTTVLSLVPLLAVMLALFTAFPAFETMQVQLQAWFVQNLLPANMAQTVFGYLNEFAEKAAGLGTAGVVGLGVTATMLLLTVDRSLNLIWRTRRSRPLAQRVILFWVWLTAGPLLLAFALGQLSLAAALSAGWLGAVPGATAVLGTVVSCLIMGALFGLVYRVVPNTEVRWRDAFVGGLLAAVAFNLASRVFAWYIGRLPTYEAVYGTFATVPLALVWIYWSWLVVLGGGIVSAWLPALRAGVLMPEPGAGGDFLLAVGALRRLAVSREQPPCGLDVAALARGLTADPQRLDRVLEALESLGWVGLVDGPRGRSRRWALLVDPKSVTLAPLVDALLLDRVAGARAGFDPGELLREEAVNQPLRVSLDNGPSQSTQKAAD